MKLVGREGVLEVGAYREEGLDEELVLGEVCRGVGLVSMVPRVSEAMAC